MLASNILHATTDPDLLTRLREMLDSSARADIAVGYFFMSGFEAVADSLARLDKVRILVGRADRLVLESVALGLQQSEALRAQLDADGMLQRRQQEATAREAVEGIATGVSLLPQTGESQRAVSLLRNLIRSGLVEVRAYRRSPLHAKAYLCWYDNHAEPGVPRQLLLPACCLTEKCYRNFSTWGPLQPALIPVFHGSPAWVHRPQRRPAF